MFGLGFAELILIAVLALIFIGPKQLPDVARMIARLINEWKRITSDFATQFNEMKSDLHSQVERRETIRPPPPPAAPSTESEPEKKTEPSKDPS